MTVKSLEELKAHIRGRDLYIWGAHYLGLGLLRALTRSGIAVRALVDRNPVIQQSRPQGLGVQSPDEFMANVAQSSYVITAATLYDEEIAGLLMGAGRRRPDDFCAVTDLRSFKYSIEISGACNLRCPSCPQGNFSDRPQNGALMPLETFEKIVDKIVREDPLVWEVELYRWGEPLLNPALPQMIQAARTRGLEVVISTNLNARTGADLVEIVRAAPRAIIVSASGWGESYEVTHRGGKWDLFVKNLRHLAALQATHAPGMEVELYYHIYKNRRDDFRKIRALAAELGLTFRPTWAGLLPLDHLYSLSRGHTPGPDVAKILQMQVFPATDFLADVKKQPLLPCGLKNMLAITPNLAVPACSCWFNPEEPPLTDDFLHTPLAELIALRQKTPLCRRCEVERLYHLYLIWHEKKGFETYAGD